jgi:peptide/nickel transport system substrate-binding protein
VLAACICLVALANAQCGQGVGGNETGSPALTIHVPDSDERELGPTSAEFNWFFVFLGLADGPEDDTDPEPRLLDRWEHTPDYTEWTVHVREGVHWGDGVPVTADDVKFSLELWTRPDVWYEYRWFETITVLDSHTLRITFPDPPPATISTFNWLPILPRHSLANLDVDELFGWPFWKQPVGNGPYRYKRHVPQVMTELERNPDFYGPAPNVPTIVLRYGGNGLTELLGGNVDVATLITPVEAIRLSEDPRFRIYHRAQYKHQVAIAWNHRLPLFRDAAVRRALTMSIDRRELHRVLNYPGNLAVFDVPATERHHVQGMVPDPLPFDADRASRLFASAGWVDGDGDGILDRNGQDFRFTLRTSEETSAQAVYIQDQFRRVGVRMDVSTHERNVLRERIHDHDFDAAIDTYNYIEQFGEFPISGYVNPEVSRLRDAVWFTIDRDEADGYMRELWRIVGAEMPITFLHPRIRYLAAHRRVSGLQNTSGQMPTDTPLPLLLEQVWIEKDGGADAP